MSDQPTPHDIFVTALEGGINYWASVVSYRWSTDGGETEDLTGFKAVVVDAEEDDQPTRTIDLAVILRGLALLKEPFPEDFDVGDADKVVQLGLFGEVVYA